MMDSIADGAESLSGAPNPLLMDFAGSVQQSIEAERRNDLQLLRQIAALLRRETMIKPTIGRVVLVHRGMSDQAEPALVSYVWSDRMINVGGFDRSGVQFSAQSIQLLQDDETPTNPNYYAEWMPYQKAQAGAV